MLRPGTGWIRQTPQLASRLQPISCDTLELVSEELILKARTDWDRVCDDAYTYYRNLIKELKPLISIARDPFQRIEGIVEMDKPLDGLKLLIKGMGSSLPNKHTEPMRYHCAIRNCALVLLITLTGFRRNTISQLNYTFAVKSRYVIAGQIWRVSVSTWVQVHVRRTLSSLLTSMKAAQSGRRSPYRPAASRKGRQEAR